MSADPREFRELFLRELAKIDSDWVGVYASAGLDSWSIITGLLLLKRQVTVYSFTLKGWMSTDFSYARENARRALLPFVPVFLPTELSQLRTDMRTLAFKYKARKKTHFEAGWPFLYAAEALREEHVATGLCAGGHFGLSRNSVFSGALDEVAVLDEERTKKFLYTKNYAASDTVDAIHTALGKVSHHPYKAHALYQFFLGKGYYEVNGRKDGMGRRVVFDAFPEVRRFQLKGHANLQLGDSRIAQHCSRLVHDAELNKRQHKTVQGVYNDIVASATAMREPRKLTEDEKQERKEQRHVLHLDVRRFRRRMDKLSKGSPLDE